MIAAASHRFYIDSWCNISFNTETAFSTVLIFDITMDRFVFISRS
ncbi:unknown [Tannerella sp. CAG:118]|nr:unknown [Tannerella sp. CAG:118]